MTPASLAIFAMACFALNAAPGPNNLLAFSNATRLGILPAILGGTGRLPAFAAMIALVGVGLGAILATSETALFAVKLFGAGYLIFVGWRMWRSPPPSQTDTTAQAARTSSLIRQDFLIAIGNPKAIAIFTAFFPQFVDFSGDVTGQFVTLGLVFLCLELCAVMLYVGLGRIMSGVLTPVRLHILNRGVGGFLIFSGLAMALNSKH